MENSENVCSDICHCKLSNVLSNKLSFKAVSVGYWMKLQDPLVL
jgi:hypothetical protein